MTRAFIVTLDIDPSVDPNLIAYEIQQAVEADLGEVLSVKPWAQHDVGSVGPTPVEGSMFLGQMNPQ